MTLAQVHLESSFFYELPPVLFVRIRAVTRWRPKGTRINWGTAVPFSADCKRLGANLRRHRIDGTSRREPGETRSMHRAAFPSHLGPHSTRDFGHRKQQNSRFPRAVDRSLRPWRRQRSISRGAGLSSPATAASGTAPSSAISLECCHRWRNSRLFFSFPNRAPRLRTAPAPAQILDPRSSILDPRAFFPDPVPRGSGAMVGEVFPGVRGQRAPHVLVRGRADGVLGSSSHGLGVPLKGPVWESPTA